WFLLLPLLWTGLTDAWRLTAIPGTREAEPLDERRLSMMSATAWNVPGFVLAPARIALIVWAFYQLTIATYADGHRPVLEVLRVPTIFTLGSIDSATLTDLVGWLVRW